ncbi:Predicted PurR-regulated permease PerM [Pseudobutyrivibrio sp. YE44]|uniref:AI-2E family transporter n=1 Tax=Pseudobutyrivibrio sp. YE44 TaxID=1520802 RepID=UPI00088E1294|nr:AI-2E family transporter [Pseudobutyrivibrio sp. YE44]SDB22833.1 Predicted PurR-regulated permease PerM [Pseudobutyrivibrio sp. YE44]
MKGLKDKPWYSLTISICIGVILYVTLVNIHSVLSGINNFLSFFSTVFLGAIIAYIINPLAMFYRNHLFHKLKSEKLRATLGNTLAFVTVIIFLVFIGFMVIPQLIDSVKTFAANFNGYVRGLQRTLAIIGVSSSMVDLSEFVHSSNDLLNQLQKLASENMDTIMSKTADLGKALGQFFIAFLLAIYFLAGKDKLKSSGKRFLKAVFKSQYIKVAYVIGRSDVILNKYIVYNLIDATIVGAINAIFMTIAGLPYVGLVSVLVGLTNIIPTFGPVVGAVIGGFLLLLVEPRYAVIFLIFTAVLQTIDGYVLKPKLFGDSLGVSSLWILVGIVAGGKMFGVIGILLAIPMVAIIDMLYHEFLLPFLEKKK